MPGAKEGKPSKKASRPIGPVLQKFLRTYEKHCAQTRTSVCPALKKDLRASISNERMLRKFVLVRSEDTSPNLLPISLEPLLMTIREEGYTPARELCVWGLQLSNPEVARLALLLEAKGHPGCPLSILGLIDCTMDSWSLGRLGLALQFSSLRSLVLDYCTFGNEELEILCSGLESARGLRQLSLRFCGLGPWSGSGLGSLARGSTICDLLLDGNDLQSSGALALLRPLAEYAKTQGTVQTAKSLPGTTDPPRLLQATEREQSTLSRISAPAEAARAKTASGKKTKKKTKRKKAIKKKMEGLAEAGPWLVKLHLADNGIDGKGIEGESGLLEFTQTLTCLITYSAHLRELDLGNNVVGETAALGILEALRARKTGKLPTLKVKVTSQISSDTFRSIWRNSRKSRITHKKKKKV